ncbi:MAG: oxygen-independent coproporphyrinogen III oxidase-like protein [Rubrivivax sp.]|nr:oxygen-independent coproporphyrinogen III oxidase-like protein [Rubrivivax sp.]
MAEATTPPAAPSPEGGTGLRLAALPPLALYVHLPWCLRKCPYCDFNSHALRGELPEAAYLAALVADLESALPQIWGRRVGSVFFGGGTPSLVSAGGIERLLADIRARVPLLPDCEVTLEANPGSFERERFRAFRSAGVTRLSIGVQSFSDAALQALGRVHDAAQARAAVAEAAAAFATFNIDLMYALPGQDLAALDADLQQALAFAPPHLSIYHLTLEPNTGFALHPPPQLPDDDLASEMLDLIIARTAAAGLTRYEVSAFARPGNRCAHNLNYWSFGDYLGIGAGAHSKLSFADRIVREVRFREPATYMRRALAGTAVSSAQEVAAAELPFEFMLNALRLVEGFDAALLAERTGLAPQRLDALVGTVLEEALARGWLLREGQRIKPSAHGLDFLSDVQQLFLPPSR